MSTIDVDSVCTDFDLEKELGGTARLADVLPADWVNAKPKRQIILDRVLDSLKNSVPPVRESDLVDITELKQTVIYGTIADLLYDAMSVDGDKFHVQAKRFNGYFTSSLNSLRPTITSLETSGPRSITISRR